MPDVFQQIDDPVGGSVFASTIVAALPLPAIAVLLAVLRRPLRQAAAAAAGTAADSTDANALPLEPELPRQPDGLVAAIRGKPGGGGHGATRC